MNKNLMVPEGSNAEPKEILHNVEGGGGSDVIANPTLAGGEELLEGLQVGEEKYKVTKVTEGTGWMDDEPFLWGLDINGTKKRIPQGKARFYKHQISVNLEYTDYPGYTATLKGYIIVLGSDAPFSSFVSDLLPLLSAVNSDHNPILNSMYPVVCMNLCLFDDYGGKAYIIPSAQTGIGYELNTQEFINIQEFIEMKFSNLSSATIVDTKVELY